MVTKFILNPPLLLAAFLIIVPHQDHSSSGARMFIRYEQSQGYNRLGESLQALEHPIRSDDRSLVAIRLCSKNSLAVALATAAADPFLIADRLNAFGYPPGRIMFLRSEDCLSQNQSNPATEIWTISEKAALPGNVEAFTSSHVKLIPLGRKPGRLGMRLQKRNNQADSTLACVAIHYGHSARIFLEKA